MEEIDRIYGFTLMFDDCLDQELAEIPLGCFCDHSGQFLSVPVAEFPLDRLEMRTIPVIADHAADQQLGAFLGYLCGESLVEE